MSPAVIWLSYAVLALIGVVFYIAASTEKVFERITLPQILYAIYLLTFAAFSGWALKNSYLAMIFLSLPLVLFAWLSLSGEPERDRGLRDEFQNNLDHYLRELKEKPDNIIFMDSLGDLYMKMGEPAVAKKHFTKLLEIYAGKTEYPRLKSSLENKLERLEINGSACAGDPRFPLVLRACPQCESIALRLSYDCRRCGREFFPHVWVWRAVRCNRFFEESNLTRITIYGLVFLPFLYACGVVAYGILLGVWTLAFATTRQPVVKAPGESSGEGLLFAGRMGMLATMLCGFFLYALRPPNLSARPKSAAIPKTLSDGVTFDQILSEAKREAMALSKKADGLAHRREEEMNRKNGITFKAEGVHAGVNRMPDSHARGQRAVSE